MANIAKNSGIIDKKEKIFEDIMDTLREKLRVALGREETPSNCIIDSRTVKTSQNVDKERCIDGNMSMAREATVLATLYVSVCR